MNPHHIYRLVVVGMVLLGGLAIGAIVLKRTPEPNDSSRIATVLPATQAPARTTHRAPDPASAALAESGSTDDLPAAIRELRQILELEIQQRRKLEDELEALRNELANRTPAPANLMSAEEREKFREASGRRNRNRAGLTVDTLTEAGLDQRTATLLKSRVDELALERLYLRDSATREGWLNSPRFRDEMRRVSDLQTTLTEEFGNDAYDSYLFAIGRPNRLTIDHVIGSSPAQIAGLRPGDQVLRYDGQRIYNNGELSRRSSAGVSGEMVAIQVQRDGNLLDLYLPRGPLGVNLSNRSVNPKP